MKAERIRDLTADSQRRERTNELYSQDLNIATEHGRFRNSAMSNANSVGHYLGEIPRTRHAGGTIKVRAPGGSVAASKFVPGG